MIYIIVGKSGSGKDTIFKRLFEVGLKLNKIVEYTTRPMRTGEKDGVEYNFITEDEYNKIDRDRIIEDRSYNVIVEGGHSIWRYLTLKDNIDIDNQDYLGIGTIESVRKMQNLYGDKIQPIYVTVDNNVRIDRAVSREEKNSKPNYRELVRRFLADEVDYNASELSSIGIDEHNTFINDSLDKCCRSIKNFILDSLKDRLNK